MNVVAQAQPPIVSTVYGTAQLLIPVLFTLATVVFLWSVVRFILAAGDPDARTKARGGILWGIVGLAAMAAAWGVAQLLISSFGIPSEAPTFVPPPVGSPLPSPTPQPIPQPMQQPLPQSPQPAY